ncbi:MAG: amidohydrolase family protein [Gemmatimonadaceae bacterium]
MKRETGDGRREVLRVAVAALVLCAPLMPRLAATQPVTAIRNATVVPVVGARVPNATVLIRNGRIEAVGANVQVPAGATVIDATGMFVYPGFIDSGTRLGLTEMGGVPGPDDTRELGDFNPQDFTLSAVNPFSEHIGVTRANGVTTVISSPTGGLITGTAALINLAGWTAQEMAVKPKAGMVVVWPSLGGGGGRGGFGGFGQPQMSAAERRTNYDRQVRQLYGYFDEAKGYSDVKARLTASGATPPSLWHANQKYESMIAAVRGEMPVIVEAEGADQMRDAMVFADSLKLKLIIRGGREGWRIADTLAMKRVPVIVSPTTSVPGDGAPYDEVFANAGVMSRAGVQLAFHTGSASSARDLPYNVGLAIAYGLDPDEGLKALTINPAKIWGVDKDYGSIEVGKFANLMVATGDPIDIRSQIKEVFVKGQRMKFDDRHTELYEKFRARPKP